MADPPLTAALAVLPCTDLGAARAFWSRLGFEATVDHGEYVILQGHGTEVHLRLAEPGGLVPGRNPCGVYVRIEAVDAVFHGFGEGALHPPKIQPWGLYEFAVSDPDQTLVRVGWPVAERAR